MGSMPPACHGSVRICMRSQRETEGGESEREGEREREGEGGRERERERERETPHGDCHGDYGEGGAGAKRCETAPLGAVAAHRFPWNRLFSGSPAGRPPAAGRPPLSPPLFPSPGKGRTVLRLGGRTGKQDSERGLGKRTQKEDSERGLGKRTRQEDSERGLGKRSRKEDSERGLGKRTRKEDSERCGTFGDQDRDSERRPGHPSLRVALSESESPGPSRAF